MSALAGSRVDAQALPMHPNVLLSGSERIMEGTFGVVTQSLLRLGSCPIDKLAHSSKADLEGFDLPFVSSDIELLPRSSQPPPDPGLVASDDKESQKVSSYMQFVAQLHQTCVGAFGNADALKFEFIEESGQENKKQCILTIARPSGQTRSYISEPEFSRKSDAKARAAAIAMEMGAVDFILHGNKDASNSRSKIVLAPLDSSTANKTETNAKGDTSVSEEIEDNSSKQIEALCVEWRASQVRPRWVFFQESKTSLSWGCVLVIELSAHAQRLYSVEPNHDSQSLAKKACSEAAVQQGAIDFIKYGNGQTAPAPTVTNLHDTLVKCEPDENRKGRASAISLQAFFDSLPKPFPEPIGDKSAVSNINAPGMLNTILQLARGARLNLQFYFRSENGLHGSILRLVRPEETKTYMVDTRFSKRSDAKSAVCLHAVSQGIGLYIRSLAAAVDNKITQEMRKRANEQILPILGSEYGKLRHGMHPEYDYDHEQGAFSCKMTLSLSADAKPEETRSWSVNPEYRTKTDAKIAVVCAAGVEAIEFVRFRGERPPPDYDPFKPYKRKEREGSVEQRSNTSPKRPVPASGLVRLGLPINPPLLETKEEARARQMAAARWEHEQFPSRQPPRRQFPHSHNPSQPRQSVAGPSYTGESQWRGPPPRLHHSSTVAAAAINQATFSPTHSSSHSQTSRTNHRAAHSPSSFHSRSQEYSQVEIQKLRPPRRSQQHSQPLYPLPTDRSYIGSRPEQENAPSPPHPHPANSQSSQPVVPPQPALYGTAPQPQQQSPAYPSVTYPTGYGQPPYPYPMQQGAPYPTQPNGYPYPVPPAAQPTYGVHAYPTYTAYYADPRYAQYTQYPQYGIATAPVAYAFTVAPAPGMQYATPPPPPPAQTTAPADSTQPNMSLPTPLVSSADEPASARRPEISASPVRTASFSSESDRQKRRRSQEMSMSPEPEDSQLHKKHRSEPSLPSASVKRESASTPPGPRTPVSDPKDSASNVEQLLRYCESEGLSSPEFGSKQTKNEHGQSVFKVWIVMGNERLELPITYLSETEGRQRVAKQVLQRLQSQSVGK